MTGRERASPLGRRWPIALAGVLGLALVSGGCETRDPNAPLSDEEGAALVKDVRTGKKGVNDLTPADRAYLKKKTGK